MLESAIERRLITLVKRAGGLCIKLDSIAGLPDRLIILPNGRVAFVELKQDGGKATRLQEVWIERLRERGHEAVVLAGKVEVEAWAADYLSV